MSHNHFIQFGLALVATLLFVINAVIFEGLSIFLGLSYDGNYVVVAVLCIIAAGFLLATYFGMNNYTKYTRTAYYLTSIGIGCIGYFFLASTLFLVLFAFTGIASEIIGSVLFGLASLSSLYGVLHARTIVIKRISIVLPHLPEVWKERTMVWISDVHAGQIYGKKYIERIVTMINELKPSIVVIGGDLFDGSAAPEILKAIEPLRGLVSPLGTYFVTGNHEEIGPVDLFLDVIRKCAVTVLDNEMIAVDGLQIIGADYKKNKSKVAFESMLAKVNIDPNQPSILLKHEPSHLKVAERAGISVHMSGHTHKGQLWPMMYLEKSLYSKFVYGLQSLKNMQVYTSSGVGTWGPPMRVGSQCEIVEFSFSNK